MVNYLIHNQGCPSKGSIAYLNSTTDMLAYRFSAQESKTVTAIRLYRFTGGGTSPTYRIGLQGDSAGKPDGTWLGATNTGYSDSQISSTWNTFTLNETVSLTSGTTYHIVMQYQSGTCDASNYASMMRVGFRYHTASMQFQPLNKSDSDINFPDSQMFYWFSSNGGSTWASDNESVGTFLFDYDDATYGGQPYNSGMGTYTYGVNWQSQIIVVSGTQTIKSIGFLITKSGTPADDLYYEIRNSSETVLRSGFLTNKSSVTSTIKWIDATLSSPLELLDGETYRLVFNSPNSVNTSNCYRIYRGTGITTTPYKEETYGGDSCFSSTSTDSGSSWSNWVGDDVVYRLSDTGIYENLINSRIKINDLNSSNLCNASIQTTQTYSNEILSNARISIPNSDENLLNSRIKIKYGNENKTDARIKVPSNSEISSNGRIKIPYSSENILSSRIKLEDQSSELISSARLKTIESNENVLNAKISGIYASLNLINARIKTLSEADEILLSSKTVLHNFSQKLISSRILKELDEENQLQARIKLELDSDNLLNSRIEKEFSSNNLVSGRIKKEFNSEELINSRIQIPLNSINLLNSKIQLNSVSEVLLNATIAALGFSDELLNAYIFIGFQDSLVCNARVVFNPKITRVLAETIKTEPARIGGDRIFPTG